MHPKRLILLLSVLVTAAYVTAAPTPNASGIGEDVKASHTDLPVEQLEKLKSDGLKEGKETVPVSASEHVEYHSLDAIKSNGELVSRLEQHATADAVPGEKPHVHAHLQYDVPSEGVHKEVVQDGEKVQVHDATVPTTTASEEQTTKVFHGAARLVKATGASSAGAAAAGHTAVRRAFNADINKETHSNMDHYSSYSGVQYSPLDMAEYVFWTGDERGVTAAIEEFLQEGLMSKEEAIAFLQEIKFNIDYLKAHYSQSLKAAEESAQQEKLRSLLLEQANNKMSKEEAIAFLQEIKFNIDYLKAHYSQSLKAAEESAQQEKLRSLLLEQANNKDAYQLHTLSNLQSFPFGNSPDIIRTITNKNYLISNNLTPAMPMFPVEYRSEPVKRTYPDAMLQSNVINTSDYDRDGPMVSEEEYEEMMEKLKMADSLYTQYTLEEIIYQLAKMMFSQSLTRDPREARAAIQRFMAFLEMEAERGQLSRSIEKKVLDVMVAALTDTIGDHPELLQSRDYSAIDAGNRLMRQFLEQSAAEPSMSRAILSAYKDELLKGPPMPKFSFPERN